MQRTAAQFRRGFTLIELMVAVGIIVLLIAAVGAVFKTAATTVGVSEASNDVFARARALNQQITDDVHGMDKNGFLIIRCVVDPNDATRRFDQISFISRGRFPNRCGAYQGNQLFADTTTSNVARIWYGQVVTEVDASASSQDTGLSFDQLPNANSFASINDPLYETGFTLGRQATLLLNPPSAAGGIFPAGYQTIQLTGAGNTPPAPGSPLVPPTNPFMATISPSSTDGSGGADQDTPAPQASRLDVAYTSVPQLMQTINQLSPGAPLSVANRQQVAEEYCYRYKVLPKPTATDVVAGGNQFLPNGVFRMHPIFAQNVSSFAIDWTDGTAVGGVLRWFGYNTGATGMYSDVPAGSATTLAVQQQGTVDAPGVAPSTTSTNPPLPKPPAYASDNYAAVFTPADGAASWPRALRFTYRLTDPNNRLNGGRTFVCIVDLPQ